MKKFLLPLFALIATMFGTMAFAANTGTTYGNFQGVMDMLDEWSKGTLGKSVALAALVIGIVGGVMKQSIAAVASGLAIAIVLNYGPDAVVGVFTAML